MPVPEIDFSTIGNLPKIYKDAQLQANRERTLAELGQGAGPLDYNTIGRKLLSTDPEFGLSLLKLGQQQGQQQGLLDVARGNLAVNQGELDIKRQTARAAGSEPKLYDIFDESGQPRKATYDPTTKAFQMVGGAKAKDLAAADKKALLEAEDEIPAVKGTLETLALAKDLNNKAFTGWTAGLRGTVGTSNVPGTNLVIDRAGAEATNEWSKAMRPEAIKLMASTLKGASTDRELFEFTNTLADPATPPEIRGRVIDRMMEVAKRKLAISEARIKEIRGQTYFKPGGGGGGQTPGGPAQPNSKQEYDALKPGTRYVAPDGSVRTKQ